MTDNNDEFLVEGVRRAADIRDTLETFESLMRARLEKIVVSRTSWSPLKNVDTGSASSKASRGRQPSLVAWVNGQFNDRLTNICAGIWWNSPAKIPTILYAVAWDDAKDKGLPLGSSGLPAGISLLSGQYVYAVPPERPVPLDLDREYERLLDALLDALSKSTPHR